MDETVVVDAGQDPLDDLQCARTWPQLIEMPLPAIAPSLLGREGRDVTHLESNATPGLNAHPRPRVARFFGFPAARKRLKRGIMRGHVHHQSHQLIAPPAERAMEALALETKGPAR